MSYLDAMSLASTKSLSQDSLDLASIRSQSPQNEPAQVSEETRKIQQTAASIILAAWKERKQKKHEFKIVLNPQLTMNTPYASEVPSLELGLKDDKNNQIAIYQDGYTKLTEKEKEWLRNPKVTSEEKMKYIRSKGLFLTSYFSDEKLESYRFTDLTSKVLAPYGENCIIIKGKNIYVYPKVKPQSYKGMQKAGKNHSSASRGQPIDFSGSLKKAGRDRWVISNLSGHYGTRASKLATCLKAFQDANISLKNIDVEHQILVTSAYAKKFSSPSFKKMPGATKDKQFLVKTTDATQWIKQTSRLRCSKKQNAGSILIPKIDSCCTIS